MCDINQSQANGPKIKVSNQYIYRFYENQFSDDLQTWRTGVSTSIKPTDSTVWRMTDTIYWSEAQISIRAFEDNKLYDPKIQCFNPTFALLRNTSATSGFAIISTYLYTKNRLANYDDV